MCEIEELGGFFRQGRVGSWKDQFTFTQNELFDRIYDKRITGTGLDFDFGG